jgi:lipid A 3-O-deacylase
MKSGLRRVARFLSLISILGSAHIAGAEDLSLEPKEPHIAEEFFAHGKYEATLSSGVLFSPFGSPESRPVINYTISSVQLGYMLSDITEAAFLRGNFEIAGSLWGSAVYKGPGNYLAGGTFWARYNFVPRGWRLTPYIQAGAGFTFTDIDRGLVGQEFNFNLNLGCGFRFFINRQWSINAEYLYQHISNANLGHNNIGINSQGPVVGVSYLF